MSGGRAFNFPAVPPLIPGSTELCSAMIKTLKADQVLGTINPAPNVLYVTSLSDFPDPDVNDDIYLDPDISYIISGDVDIGLNRIVLNNTSTISGTSLYVDNLIGSSSRELINIPNQTTKFKTIIKNIGIENQAGNNCLLANTDVGVTLENINFTGGSVEIEAATVLYCFGLNFTANFGLIIGTLTTSVSLLNCFWLITDASVGVDIPSGASSPVFLCRESLFVTFHPSAIGIRVDSQDQITQGTIQGTIFEGVGVNTDSFDSTSDNWEFDDNLGITDSSDQGTVTACPGDASPGEIELLTGQVWVNIESITPLVIVYSEVGGAEKFTLTDTVTGEMTYNGSRTRNYKITGTVAVKRRNSPDIDIELGISLNGASTPITSTIAYVNAQNRALTINIPTTTVTLSTGDTLILQARNIDVSNPANNIRVLQAKLTIYI